MVMELVEGETLEERLAHGSLPIDEALPIFEQIAEGLASAHAKGIRIWASTGRRAHRGHRERRARRADHGATTRSQL